MKVKNGYLLISDITGYAEFLVESELQHAKEILDTLLKTGVKSIRPPIRVLNTRGEAILAFAAENDFIQPQSLNKQKRRLEISPDNAWVTES
jgi:hypothetical protein